jgi:hypothetical protein
MTRRDEDDDRAPHGLRFYRHVSLPQPARFSDFQSSFRTFDGSRLEYSQRMPRSSLPALALSLLLVSTPAAAQQGDPPTRFAYVRLGASMVMADDVRHVPAAGFGLRAQTESFAVDVSGLNVALGHDPDDRNRAVVAGSLLKIMGIKFLSPDRERSSYVGGGLSWGFVSAGRTARPGGRDTSWHGSGLQGELTAGYELARSGSLRFFAQADASVPFFRARSESYDYPTPGTVVRSGSDHRYIPSVVLSLGVGWRRR